MSDYDVHEERIFRAVDAIEKDLNGRKHMKLRDLEPETRDEIIATWYAILREHFAQPDWTLEPPTEPGWYWIWDPSLLTFTEIVLLESDSDSTLGFVRANVWFSAAQQRSWWCPVAEAPPLPTHEEPTA